MYTAVQALVSDTLVYALMMIEIPTFIFLCWVDVIELFGKLWQIFIKQLWKINGKFVSIQYEINTLAV